MPCDGYIWSAASQQTIPVDSARAFDTHGAVSRLPKHIWHDRKLLQLVYGRLEEEAAAG